MVPGYCSFKKRRFKDFVVDTSMIMSEVDAIILFQRAVYACQID
jgi:hypothetical protein